MFFDRNLDKVKGFAEQAQVIEAKNYYIRFVLKIKAKNKARCFLDLQHGCLPCKGLVTKDFLRSRQYLFGLIARMFVSAVAGCTNILWNGQCLLMFNLAGRFEM